MRLGLVTPVVTMLPRAHAAWEETAGIDEIAAIAEAADRLGYHHLTCSEHVAIPAGAVAETRGARYWDPLATFGFLAARTAAIRFATHVLVLGYHHPMAIAKRYGTLDQVCGGRLILGVGVGSLEEEFALLGAPFEDRGARADESLRTLRRVLGRREVDGFVVDPCARQERMPIWVGGRTARSLRRAVALGDGWAPFGLSRAQLRALLDRTEHPAGFEVVLAPEPPLDPSGDPDRVQRVAAELASMGATILNVRVVHHSLAHYLEQLEALPRLCGG